MGMKQILKRHVCSFYGKDFSLGKADNTAGQRWLNEYAWKAQKKHDCPWTDAMELRYQQDYFRSM